MISIRIIQPDTTVLDRWAGADKRVYLDLDGNFQLQYTKAIEELTEANRISQEAALSFSVPATLKNSLILKGQEDPLEIEMRKDGKPLPGKRLEVIKEDDRGRRIEIEIFGAGWVTDLEKVFLVDLDLGTFEYTKANVEAAWATDQPAALPAPASYGGWNTPGDITRKDLRFWFNLFDLMQKAFCKIGWQFESEYFEKAGAKTYGYLGGERWYGYSDKSDIFRVDLNLAAPLALVGSSEVVIFDEVSDPFDLYNNFGLGGRPSEYLYPPAGLIGIDLEIQIRSLTVTLPPAPAGSLQPQFSILAYRNRPPQIEFLGFEQWPGPAPGATGDKVLTVDITFIDTECRAGDSYAIFFTYEDEAGNPYAYTMESANIVYSPNPPYYIEDDTIDLASTIDQDINALELFKAMAHLCNGKVETDEAMKTVRLFPPYNATQEGQLMNGFFKRDKPADRIDDKIIPNSMIRTNNKNEANRYVLLQFANSTDSYIDQQGREEQVFSRTIDRGSGKANTTRIDNPLFEPSLEHSPDPADTGTTTSVTGLSLIALWDNTDGEISNKIGPRVAHWYGLVEQLDNAGTAIDWSWEGGLQTALPYISMSPIRPMTGNPAIYPLVFSDRENDLWRLFYRRWINEQTGSATYEVLAYLTLADYQALNFRNMVAFFYIRNIQYYQPINVKDYGTNEDEPTIITLKKITC